MADTEGKTPFNIWWVAAAGFLVLVVVGAVVLGFQLGRSGDDDPAAAETTPAEAPVAGGGETEAVGGQDRECGALSDDQDYPTEAPPTEWQTYGSSSMTVPVSDEYGPLKRGGTLWECYAHSPTGAVYAGLGLIASFSIGGEYAAAIDSPQAESALEKQAAESGASFPAFSGFRIDEYSDEDARITYYGQQGEYTVGISFSVKWDVQADDWRLDWSRPEGFEESPPSDQFVMWER